MPPEAPDVAMLMGDLFARLAEQQGSRELLLYGTRCAAAKTEGRDRKYGLAQEGIA